ncbi:unnamed protein product [Clonostachys rosea f. rosea IK726]|uniref:Uncharacterized protein n=1 Tax=Clonostachys rosea f. rosea IK726 TaxID=1349383 RepID=A0ACA9TLR1_BIOOC|nr:unnamed protein product [Clonostachys rosea f. rosea IK726]
MSLRPFTSSQNFPDTDVPSKDDKGVIYYGPGYHKLSSPIVVGSGETLYLAGGAVVSAPDITVTNSSEFTLRGRGFYTAKGQRYEYPVVQERPRRGLVGINFFPRTFEAKDITFRRWCFSAVKWGDGIDLYSSRNILIDSVFYEILMTVSLFTTIATSHMAINSILWADVAHPINVGTHGNTKDPETVDGVTIRNIDILDQREKQMLYQGTIALNAGDSNLIQNVLIEDVRVEDIRLGQLLNFRVMYNDKYNTSPGRGIRNVLVRNLRYDGRNAGTSIFTGYDEERTISNVTFENLVVNGLPISDTMQKPGWYFTTDFIPLYANEHVKNLTFKST